MNRKATETRTHGALRKILITTSIIASIPIIIIVLVMAWSGIANYKDKSFLNKAAKEIQLPSNFVLTHTTYSNDHCLDTCAYMVLHYKSADGKPLDREVVNRELERIGYKQNESDMYYGNTLRYKYFDNNDVLHTEQLGAPPDELNLMISK